LLYFDAESLRTILICTRDTRTMFVHAPPPSVGAGRDPHVTAFTIILTLRTEPIFAEILDSLEGDHTAAPQEAGVSAFSASLLTLYQDAALALVASEQRVACARAMSRGGFRDILGDSDLVRALALLGLLSSCDRRIADAPAAFADVGLVFD